MYCIYMHQVHDQQTLYTVDTLCKSCKNIKGSAKSYKIIIERLRECHNKVTYLKHPEKEETSPKETEIS